MTRRTKNGKGRKWGLWGAGDPSFIVGRDAARAVEAGGNIASANAIARSKAVTLAGA